MHYHLLLSNVIATIMQDSHHNHSEGLLSANQDLQIKATSQGKDGVTAHTSLYSPQEIGSYNLNNYDNYSNHNPQLLDNKVNNSSNNNNNNNNNNNSDENNVNIDVEFKYDEDKILDLKNPDFGKQLWNNLKLYAPKGDILSIVACNAGVVAITDGIHKVSIKKKDFMNATKNALKHIDNLPKLQRGLMALKWSCAVPLISFIIDLIICGYKWHYDMYSHEEGKNKQLCKQELKNKFFGMIGGIGINCGLTMFLGMSVVANHDHDHSASDCVCLKWFGAPVLQLQNSQKTIKNKNC